MNYRKGCPDRHEDVAALAMGILPAGETAALHKHLDSCEGCRAFHNTMARQEDYLVSSFDTLVQSAQAADHAATGDTPPPAVREQTTVRLPAVLGRMGRAVAFHPRVAIAAVILAGAIGLFALSWRTGKDPLASPAQAAYSDVLRQIAKARSVRFTESWQDDAEEKAFVVRKMAQEGGWMRVEHASDCIIIESFATGDRLSLNPLNKTAQQSHIIRGDRLHLVDYVNWIQTLHERDAVYTGRESLDGVPVDVYVADQPYEKITVWADARTNLPVRVVKRWIACTDKDIRVPYMELFAEDFMMPGEEPFAMERGVVSFTNQGPGVREANTTVTLSDFAWNIDFDQSLFNLTPPDGYRVVPKIDYGGEAEDAQGLVEALRFWAEMSSGRLPDNINMLSDAEPLLIRRYRGSDRSDEAFYQAVKMMHVLARGMYFAEQLKADDNWHYAGKTVCLGQADKPLAWWLDKKTGLWQVIYGDLHTEALPADQKPADPAGEGDGRE